MSIRGVFWRGKIKEIDIPIKLNLTNKFYENT